jgi:hypothetical protein
MRMGDILRDLAELLDQKETGSQGADLSQNSTQQRMEPVQPEQPELGDNPVMVPPLQAKLEILKKSEGLPNVYDKEGSDELSAIKKNAGLTAAQHEASEDNDITG